MTTDGTTAPSRLAESAAALPRRVSAALFVATICAGLAVHLHGRGLPPDVRDITGDVLWAAMIFWLVSFAVPAARLLTRAAAAIAICFGVEVSQLIRAPALDTVRHTTVGHLFLGSGFDARDLVAYTAGVAGAGMLAWTLTRRRQSHE